MEAELFVGDVSVSLCYLIRSCYFYNHIDIILLLLVTVKFDTDLPINYISTSFRTRD